MFVDADGELLIIPQQGTLAFTELGRLDVRRDRSGRSARREVPGAAVEGEARGYLAENYGLPFRLPDLGPIGSTGSPTRATSRPRSPGTRTRTSRPRSSRNPSEPVDDDARPFAARRRRLARQLRAVPLRSLAVQHDRHGQLRPSRSVDLHRTDSPEQLPGRANADFVIFPPRWMVGEDTFRPPWFHRNVMSEAMGLIYGAYDAKAEGFAPGGLSPAQSDERPRARRRQLAQSERGRTQAGQDRGHDGVHGRDVLGLSSDAMGGGTRAARYDQAWAGFPKAKLP